MNTNSGPLTPEQWTALNHLAEGITPEQAVWISGYLAGFTAAQNRATPLPLLPSPLHTKPAVTVLFGSQTGNAEKLAQSLHTRLSKQGFPARLENMVSFKTAQLKRDPNLLLIVSTYGEGEPPDTARGFYEFLFSKKAPKLDGLHYSVLALGDSSYEHFCKTGRDFDARLVELGASRLAPVVECDLDFEETAEIWIETALAKLAPAGVVPMEAPPLKGPTKIAAYSKKNPFPATLLDNIRLTGRGSSKEVRHIELSLAGSGLRFEPGDALGVVVSNWPQRVGELLESLGLSHNAPMLGMDGEVTTLESALLHDFEITTLTRPFLEKYAQLAEAQELAALLKEEKKADLKAFTHGREIIDVVRRFPVPGITAGQFVTLLRRLQPRAYSIASSHNANPEEVHLTVGVVRYESHGLLRQGVASTFLADRVGEEGQVKIYVDTNSNFRLPHDPNTPIIMVGPGTGVAPFRAFLEEREAAGATGKNWLFFGDRNFLTDFLYQREWLEHRKNGLLNKIDVAFSRDGTEKVYVQDRMRENRRELYAWLQEGAHFYVCGDAQRMAPDVHAALLEIVASESGLGHEHAVETVQSWQAAKRYQRDIY